MTFWWAWWLANALRLKRRSKPPVKPVPRPKARTVAAYRRSGDTDELRRIH